MGFFNAFSSEQKTDQTAYNQQVGASSGSLAIGVGAHDNVLSLTSSNPEVVEAALASNVVTSKAAIDSAGGVAALSIAGTALAGRRSPSWPRRGESWPRPR